MLSLPLDKARFQYRTTDITMRTWDTYSSSWSSFSTAPGGFWAPGG